MSGPKTGVDETRAFKPVRIAVLAVSDTRTLETDSSGATLAARITDAGHCLAARALVRDEQAAIRDQVKAWLADPGVDAIITTGGTGLTGRDVTVESVRPLFEKEIEGFAVIFHQVSYRTVGLSTLQSRACAGVVRGKIIFLLPGSTGAVKDAWDEIIRYELDARYRPCNLVEIMPRFTES